MYRDSIKDEITEINVSDNLQHCFQQVRFSEPVNFNDERLPIEILRSFKESLQTPICKFSLGYHGIDEIQTELFSLISNQITGRIEGWNPKSPISYLIGELTCNIRDHSRASYGYIVMQCPENDDSLFIGIADNGISIYGSYEESGKPELARIIDSNYAEALRYSTKGVSTKNRPNCESRGYGISTNLDMVVNGLGGEFFILSGKAFYRSDFGGEQFVNLPDGVNWDGTIVLVKIPLKQSKPFNFYKYIG